MSHAVRHSVVEKRMTVTLRLSRGIHLCLLVAVQKLSAVCVSQVVVEWVVLLSMTARIMSDSATPIAEDSCAVSGATGERPDGP